MGRVVEGFTFNDFCLKCQKVTAHRVEVDGKNFLGICSSCNQPRIMANMQQVYYPGTQLWVTKFKIGNLDSVVAGKLLEAARNA